MAAGVGPVTLAGFVSVVEGSGPISASWGVGVGGFFGVGFARLCTGLRVAAPLPAFFNLFERRADSMGGGGCGLAMVDLGGVI